MTTFVPLQAARALALEAQSLTHRENSHPTRETILEVVNQVGAVQIDTLHVVARAHYMLIWSRLGTYDPADFDTLLFDPADRQLFEYWKKAACVVPLDEYRYHQPKMERFLNYDSWFKKWIETPGAKEALDLVRERITGEGALRGADFEYNGPKRDSWWDWKPTKKALEYLFGAGELMIANRVKFQRVYDLTERVLPGWVDTTPATRAEADRFFIEQAGQCLGIARPLQLAEYAYMGRGRARPIVENLIDDETLVVVKAETFDGTSADMVVHKNNLPLLQKALDGAIKPDRTTFMTFFDNLFWAKGRDQDFWNYSNVLEAYKREEDRIWGYFCLSILHKDRIVGRFDPKVERKTGRMILKALYLEPHIQPDEELVADFVATMRDFMRFHKATELVIERSDPKDFGKKVQRLLK